MSQVFKGARVKPPRPATFYLNRTAQKLAVRTFCGGVGCSDTTSSNVAERPTLAYLACSIAATCLSLNMDR